MHISTDKVILKKGQVNSDNNKNGVKEAIAADKGHETSISGMQQVMFHTFRLPYREISMIVLM